MLPNNAIVEQVYSGPDGILSSIKEVGMVVVNDFSLLIYRSYYINNWMGSPCVMRWICSNQIPEQ